MVVLLIFSVIYVISFFLIYLNPKTKKFLYPLDFYENMLFEDALNEFDKNKKAIDDLDTSSAYKLESGHIYQ